MRNWGIINCRECGNITVKRSASQKYCPQCSEDKDLKRKRVWARDNKKPLTEKQKTRREELKVIRKKLGADASQKQSFKISVQRPEPNLRFLARVSYPFDWAMSKNSIWSHTRSGHVFIRKEVKNLKNGLMLLIKSALKDCEIFQGKIWLDITIEKPDQKGDAVNFLDFICDAVKDVIGVDDRWYSVRWIDWTIVKKDPQIYIGIGQETTEDMQICSYCGRELPLKEFYKNKANKLGVTRVCRECNKRTG